MIELLLLSTCAAILAVELQISTLAYWIKSLLYLNEENKNITSLCKFKTYPQIIINKKLLIIMYWLVFISVVVLNVHQYVRKLLECTYCTSFWLGLLFMYLTIPFTVITFSTIITYALIPLPVVSVYTWLRNKT